MYLQSPQRNLHKAKPAFCSGIIAQLSALNNIINSVDYGSRYSANNVLNSIPDLLRNVADP